VRFEQQRIDGRGQHQRRRLLVAAAPAASKTLNKKTKTSHSYIRADWLCQKSPLKTVQVVRGKILIGSFLLNSSAPRLSKKKRKFLRAFHSFIFAFMKVGPFFIVAMNEMDARVAFLSSLASFSSWIAWQSADWVRWSDS